MSLGNYHLLIRHTNDRYLPTDEMAQSGESVKEYDDDPEEISINEVVNDDDQLLRVSIDRPALTTSGLHRRYGYQPKATPSPLQYVRGKARQCRCSLGALKGFLLYVFPALSWLPKYNIRTNIAGDLMAGLTVGTVNIPQSMAFSLLAELPPVYGLYTAFFAPLAFFLMGSSRHTSVGTFGVVSILAADAVDETLSRRYGGTTSLPATTSPPTAAAEMTSSSAPNASMFPTVEPCGEICAERVKIHVTLCFIVGLIQILMATFRLGFVTVYLAYPLVRAFTAGAAFHVITSQVPPLFGLSLTRYRGPLSLIYTWRDIFINLPNTNVASLLFGVLTFVILAPGKYLSLRYKERLKLPIPWELLVVIITILISYFVNVEDKYDVDIIADIPLGFPPPIAPSFVYFGDVIGDAIAIAIVGFAVSVSVAKIFATKNDYEIESNQELMGYGAANLTSSFFSCFVSASALGRVAILDGSGGKTQVAMIVSSMLVMLTLLVLGPLFEPLPKSVLSAIIIYALRGMMAQFLDLRVLFKTSKIDCTIWIVTWLAVFLLGVDLGLGVGVVFALFTVIVRTQLPRFVTEGRLAGSELYRDGKEYKTDTVPAEICIFQMQATLYYANAEQFKRAIYSKAGVNPMKRLAELTKSRKGSDPTEASDKQELDSKGIEGEKSAFNNRLKTIIIDCRHFDFIDVSGARTIDLLSRDFRRIGIDIVYSSCSDAVRQEMLKMIPVQEDDKEGALFFPSTHDAVLHVSSSNDGGGSENNNIASDFQSIVSAESEHGNEEDEQKNATDVIGPTAIKL